MTTLTVIPTDRVIAELEAILEHDAKPRIQCTPLGDDNHPVLEPRIVPWRGWNVDHTWQWKRGEITHRVTVCGSRLEMLNPAGYVGLHIIDTPFTPTVIQPTESLTMIQDVARPVVLP